MAGDVRITSGFADHLDGTGPVTSPKPVSEPRDEALQAPGFLPHADHS
jgi:hypothetical protein